MKVLSVKIPDGQIRFFKDLVKRLGFEFVEDPAIPEEHKAIVGQRIASSYKADLIPWDDARKSLRKKN
jgi:hypothetical protein